MTIIRLLLLGGVLALLATATSAQGQVKKKPEEPVKDKKLAGVLKDFKHKEAKNRLAALRELEQMAEIRPSDVKAAVPYVLPLLKDTDAGVRRMAIITLETLEAESRLLVPPLVDILKKDKDATVRLAAILAVKNIGPPAKDAIPALEAIQKQVKGNPKEKALATEVNAALQQIRKK